ncbi:uroporphyrinogen-III synthase [Pseudonocardia eucalypti]|nr:uroporphyrinogen-III synthase [Pseudonocardia eucalypti]
MGVTLVAETGSGVPPLAGFTVGVTAARRAEELGALLERRGAVVVHAPALRIVPLPDDAELAAATRSLIQNPPDLVIATTGIGFRGWVEAADGWGLGEDLLDALRPATVLCRGPKARGAVRAAGLVDAWSPASESSAEVLEHLLDAGVDGKRIAVQLHGEPLPDLVEALECAGADVVTVPVYRWVPPDDIGPVDRLTDAVIAGSVDALTFTSAPAAASLLARAAERGLRDELVAALRGPVLAVCVGPVTAAPLQELDIPNVQPRRSRLGAMVRRLEAEAPNRTRGYPAAGHWLELRGHAALVDGELRALPPAGMALLRALTRRPGRVVGRAELLRALPGGGDDEHAVETAIARLRAALGAPKLVQTVVKRGYRLALDPVSGPAPLGGQCVSGDYRRP